MKPAVGLVLFAVIFICSGASAQKGTSRCPRNNPTFGICVFDPNVNCLEDSACKGGQICCPDGCNKICKDPEMDDPSSNRQPTEPSPSLMVKHCPQPSGTFGICSYDESINCLSDDACKSGQLCCSEGCNKVCKDPVTFQPLKPEPKVPMSSNNGGRRQSF